MKSLHGAERARFTHAVCLVLLLGLTPTTTSTQPSAPRRAYTTWSDYGGSADSMQYSALKQINKANVEPARAGVVPIQCRIERGNFGFNPMVVDGVMYVLGTNNAIVALDAATGKQIWSHPVEGGGPGNRGINYWESKDGSDRRLIFGAGSTSARSTRAPATPIKTFGDDGRVICAKAAARPLGGPSGTPGRVFENLSSSGRTPAKATALPPGDLRAFDVVTGQARLDVPHHSASGRVRLRHLAEGRVEIRRRRQCLGRDLGRREARHRLFPARLADPRHVRRRPQGREPLRQLAARARRAHRQAALALPARASRSLGLRPDHRAEAADGTPRRQDRSTSWRRRPSSDCCMCSTA